MGTSGDTTCDSALQQFQVSFSQALFFPYSLKSPLAPKNHNLILQGTVATNDKLLVLTNIYWQSLWSWPPWQIFKSLCHALKPVLTNPWLLGSTKLVFLGKFNFTLFKKPCFPTQMMGGHQHTITIIFSSLNFCQPLAHVNASSTCYLVTLGEATMSKSRLW